MRMAAEAGTVPSLGYSSMDKVFDTESASDTLLNAVATQSCLVLCRLGATSRRFRDVVRSFLHGASLLRITLDDVATGRHVEVLRYVLSVVQEPCRVQLAAGKYVIHCNELDPSAVVTPYPQLPGAGPDGKDAAGRHVFHDEIQKLCQPEASDERYRFLASRDRDNPNCDIAACRCSIRRAQNAWRPKWRPRFGGPLMIPAGVTLCGPDAIETLDSESSNGSDDDENNEEQVSDGSNDTGSEEGQMTRESLLGYRESLSTPRPPPCGAASVKLQECAIYGSDESGVTTLGDSSRLLMIRCNINRTARKMVTTLDPEQAPPGIHVCEGSGELVDCVVDDNGQGVGVGKGTVTMTGCAITNSHCWGVTVGFEESGGSINIGDGCTVEGSGNEWAAVMSGTLVGDVKNRGDIKTDFEEYM
jgi:hypothetical protein